MLRTMRKINGCDCGFWADRQSLKDKSSHGMIVTAASTSTGRCLQICGEVCLCCWTQMLMSWFALVRLASDPKDSWPVWKVSRGWPSEEFVWLTTIQVK